LDLNESSPIKLIQLFKEVLIEGQIDGTLVNKTYDGYNVKFILSKHADERRNRVDNYSEITYEELISAIEEAIPKIVDKAFKTHKRNIVGPVNNGMIYIRDSKTGQLNKKDAQEFFIYKKESELQIKCKVLNFDKNKGYIEIIIKTLMKSRTDKLNMNDPKRNTLYLNIFENINNFENYFIIEI